jgi:protein-S-isoprenylcysteine O-methyltransferase Ste14
MMHDKPNPADSRYNEGATRPASSSSRVNGTGQGFSRVGWFAFALTILVLAVPSAYAYLFADAALEANRMSRPWYGNWGSAAFAVAFFSVFVLAFLRSPRRREWRHLGAAEAYLVVLFAEMFGLPFTIYLLGSVLGVNLGFGMLEGHLWAVLFDRLGLLPLEQGVAVVMAVSSTLINLGLLLMAIGWWQIWRARDELVTGGLYRFVRHPQYTGFLLVILAFLIQWPTLPTLVLFPVLLVAYVRLARREERELERRFGERYAAYRARTPMLLPRWSAHQRNGDGGFGRLARWWTS